MEGDAEQLEVERLWSPWQALRRFREAPPAGASAMGVLALALTLVAWLVTARHFLLPLSWPRGGALLAAFLAEALVAGAAARWLWAAVGETLRQAVRPWLERGPLPFVVVVLVLAVVGSRGVQRELHRALFPPAPTAGLNWRMVVSEEARFRIDFDEAAARCAALGDGWRVPARGDLEAFTPPLRAPRGVDFWLEPDDGGALTVGWDCVRGGSRERVCGPQLMRHMGPTTAFTLCFRPDGDGRFVVPAPLDGG